MSSPIPPDPNPKTDPTTPSDPPDTTKNPTFLATDQILEKRARANANFSKFRSGQIGKKLGAAALGGLVALGGTVATVNQPGPFDLSTINGCTLDGAAPKGSEKATDNDLKNRFDIPGDEKLNGAATLENLKSQTGKSSLFSVRDSAEVVGFITEVKMGGNESCNCGTNNPQFMDTHIYISATPDADHKSCIIVEVTPRVRQIMAAAGKDWSTESLIKTYSHQHVRVSGWLFYDKEHENAAENINKNGLHNWRASCWEIHPVTSIDILPPTPAPANKTGG